MTGKTVLAITDLSERGSVAIARAAQLAGASGRLVILHVTDDGLPGKIAEELRASVLRHLEAEVQSLTAAVPGDRITLDVRSGSRWRTITAAATEYHADLIVLGAHRWRGLGEILHGSLAERLARHARTDMLMAQLPAETPYRSVLVGVDLSPASRAALLRVAELAPSARLIVVSTYHILFRGLIERAMPGEADIAAERRRIERDLAAEMDDFLADMPEQIRGARRIFVEGGPARQLAHLARLEEAELIAVGAHARSRLGEALLGSTARELLDFAPCDVFVAQPRKAQAAPGG